MSIKIDGTVPTEGPALESWITKQTPQVQHAARVFPLGSSPIIPVKVYIIGYSADGEAVAILTDPMTLNPEQLNKAVESAMLLDPDQFKDGGPHITHEAKARH